MEREDWDRKYEGDELLWRAEPNQFLLEATADLEPGTVLDVACGEGRNAIWLAEQGWRATGLDFSPVALEKARRLAASRGVDVDRRASGQARSHGNVGQMRHPNWPDPPEVGGGSLNRARGIAARPRRGSGPRACAGCCPRASRPCAARS